MPFCRGIITTDFQPPLSHIVLLSHNRRTPIMALKNAFENEKLLEFKNQKVKFTVGNSSFYVQKATDRQLENYKSSRDRKRIKKLKIDIETKGIQSINSITEKSVKYVGGKAANFGELNKIYFNSETKLQTPKAAFAIPFYYYDQHIITNGIDSLINSLLNDKFLKKDIKELEFRLKKIRKRIKKAKVDEVLMKEIVSIAIKNGIDTLRFRSSTNAEDIKGFNGAGLYDSKSGILNNNKKSYEKAMKKVWASLWNIRAFQEREFFKIDQKTIAMGILVHQSFPDEEANGVAITKNIYRPERKGFVVNIQKGDVSVVLPPQGVTSEQLIIKHNIDSKDNIEIDYISYSSLNNNEALLSRNELVELNKTLAAIKLYFYSIENPITRPLFEDFAMDIEFKIEKGTRKIIVKQARIY